MAGRRNLIAVVALVCASCACAAWAQDASSGRPTLADRLQRFRQELIGDTSETPRREPVRKSTTARPMRKTLSKHQSVLMAPSGPPPRTTEVQHAAPQQPVTQYGAQSGPPPVAAPGSMRMQSARRAQPTGDGPVTIYPAEEGGTQPQQPTPAAGSMRRPFEEARRQPSEPLDDAQAPSDEAMGPSTDEAAGETESTESMPAEADPVHVEPEAVEESFEAETQPEVVETQSDDVEPQQPVEDGQQSTPRAMRAQGNVLRSDSPSEDTGDAPQEPAVVEPDQEPAPAEPTPAEPAPAEIPAPEAIPGTDQPTPAEPAPTEPAEGVLLSAASPVISVTASGPRSVLVGKEAAFVVKVHNAGATAKNLAITIQIPSYAEVAEARPTAGGAQPPGLGDARPELIWTLDQLDSDRDETLALTLVPRRSSPLDLAISYTFTPETTQAMVEVQEPKLAMNLSGPNEVPFGESRIYKLTISNPGNGDTHNVRVSLLPIGRAGEAPASHQLGTLVAGESKTIDIELTARQAGPLSIKAQSFADGGLRAEAATQVLVRRADLAVDIEAPAMKYAGTPGTYLVKLSNTGDAAADGVKLTAVLPLDAKFLSASGGGHLDSQSGQVHWMVGSLPPGAERVLELHCAMHTPGDNRLQASATAQGDLSAAASSNTRVEAIADLKLEVRDPQGPVAVGEQAVFEIRIRNRGTKAARNVDLAVFFSEGLEPTAAEGGAHNIGSGQVVFDPIGTIEAGQAAVFHIRAQAAESGNHIFRAEVVCESLKTKLAAEEATHFYGDGPTAAASDAAHPQGEPTLASPPDDLPEPPAEEAPSE